MAQLNIHLTGSFLKDLNSYMRLKGISAKSEAIRVAIREGLERLSQRNHSTDFRAWLGIALRSPSKKSPQFKSEDDLW